jgi:hypothetical protein
VDGQPITAAHVRELLEQLDAICPGGLQAPIGGSLQVAVTDSNGALLANTVRRELERIACRGCPDHPAGAAGPATDLDCGCAVLRPPGAVDRYTQARPSAGSSSTATAPAGTPTPGSRSAG